MKFTVLTSLFLALAVSAAPQDMAMMGMGDAPAPAADAPAVADAPAPSRVQPADEPVAPAAAAASPTLTPFAVTAAVAPDGCSGVADRSLLAIPGTTHSYQIFCQAQPAGYASIPGGVSQATQATDCAMACESWNGQAVKEFTCHAAIFTLTDKKCQLFWQANGSIVPRQDSHYIVAHDF